MIWFSLPKLPQCQLYPAHNDEFFFTWTRHSAFRLRLDGLPLSWHIQRWHIPSSVSRVHSRSANTRQKSPLQTRKRKHQNTCGGKTSRFHSGSYSINHKYSIKLPLGYISLNNLHFYVYVCTFGPSYATDKSVFGQWFLTHYSSR